MTRLTTCPDADTVAARAAAAVERAVEQACAERGEAHLALSGGTTPGRTYGRRRPKSLPGSARRACRGCSSR